MWFLVHLFWLACVSCSGPLQHCPSQYFVCHRKWVIGSLPVFSCFKNKSGCFGRKLPSVPAEHSWKTAGTSPLLPKKGRKRQEDTLAIWIPFWIHVQFGDGVLYSVGRQSQRGLSVYIKKQRKTRWTLWEKKRQPEIHDLPEDGQSPKELCQNRGDHKNLEKADLPVQRSGSPRPCSISLPGERPLLLTIWPAWSGVSQLNHWNANYYALASYQSWPQLLALPVSESSSFWIFPKTNNFSLFWFHTNKAKTEREHKHVWTSLVLITFYVVFTYWCWKEPRCFRGCSQFLQILCYL